jgi:hypothetical protein
MASGAALESVVVYVSTSSFRRIGSERVRTCQRGGLTQGGWAPELIDLPRNPR